MAVKLKTITRDQMQKDWNFIDVIVRQIWDIPKANAEALRVMRNWSKNENKTGGYFFLKTEEAIIGITGYYQLSPEDFGLRHHGILPKYRIMGYSLEGIMLVSDVIFENNPSAKNLYELIPNYKKAILMPVFQKQGFEITEDKFHLLKNDYYKDGIVMKKRIRE